MRKTPQETDNGQEICYYLPPSLSTLHILESCEIIPSRCLSHCFSLHELHLPASLYLIGQQAFTDCAGLNAIFCNAPQPPSVHTDTFNGIRTHVCRVHVPAGSSEAYRCDKHWNTFTQIIEENGTGESEA